MVLRGHFCHHHCACFTTFPNRVAPTPPSDDPPPPRHVRPLTTRGRVGGSRKYSPGVAQPLQKNSQADTDLSGSLDASAAVCTPGTLPWVLCAFHLARFEKEP